MTELLLGWDAPAFRQGYGFAFHPERQESTGPTLPLVDRSDGHMLVFAPTGKGKSRGVVIPNLLNWPGPAVVIDVKGELSATTAAYRRDVLGQDVHILDPWCVTGQASAALNPLDVLKVFGQEPADQAFMLASMFSAGEARLKDPFWVERGETLIAGLMVAASVCEDAGTLGWVSDQLTSADPFMSLCKLLDRDDMPDFGRSAIAGVVTTADTTRQGIQSTAQSLVRPLMSAGVKTACGLSTLSLDSVRSGAPMTIYLVVPPAKIASQAPILKLWLSVLMSAVTDRKNRPEHETLFVLDEVAQLGPMEQVRSLLTLGRAYGCRAMLMFQSYAQLSTLYPDHLTLVENAGAVLTFGHNSRTMSATMADVFGDVCADTLFRMRPCELAIKLAGQETRIARRLDYLTDEMFRGRFAPNPMFSRPDHAQLSLFDLAS